MKPIFKEFFAIVLTCALSLAPFSLSAQPTGVSVEEVNVSWSSYDSDLAFASQRLRAHAQQSSSSASLCVGDGVMGGVSATIDVLAYLRPALVPGYLVCGGVILGVAAAAVGATYYLYTLDAQDALGQAQQIDFMASANRSMR